MGFTMHLIFDGWRLDVASRTAKRGDKTVRLSPRAVRLVCSLARTPHIVKSRTELLEEIWPGVFASDESLTQVVAEVRRKFSNRALIATVSGGGYMFTAPVTRADEPPARSAPEPAFSIDAYALCLEARACFHRGDEGSQRSFVALADQAAEVSPNYAEARGLRALALMKRHIFWSEGTHVLEAAMEEVEVALALDHTLAHVHVTQAALRTFVGQTEDGLRSLERALALAPRDPEVHLEAAIMLMGTGRFGQAATLSARAADLSPLGYGAAMLAARILEESDPQRSLVYARRALRQIRTELELDPYSIRARYALGPILAQLGDTRAARAALEDVPHHESPLEYYRAIGFAKLGDETSALQRLRFLTDRGWRHACILTTDNGFRTLHQDRRLHRLQRDALAA
ncbi:MAG: winged helix-turn-helix domain-containing protein [Pseudomonadota bacterium]